MGTRGEFKVAVTKEDLVFASAHFITLSGHRCEALHGHNYRAGAVVEGGLEADNWFVLDFVSLLSRQLGARAPRSIFVSHRRSYCTSGRRR